MTSLKERVPLVINSKARINPNTETSSNFTYKVNRNISRIKEVTLHWVAIPNTYYAINATNNVLKLNNAAKSITITPGNYNTTTLAFELKSKIDTAFADTNTTVTFSNTTYKLSIARTVAFIVDGVPTISSSTAAPILGYSVSSANALTNIANNVINIAGPNYINLVSAALTKYVFSKTLYVDNTYNTVIASIPTSSSAGGIITLTESIPIAFRYSTKVNLTTTDIIDIQLTDDLGNILDLNGSDVSLEINFTTE